MKAKQIHLDSYCISKTTKQNVAQCEIPFLAHLHCEKWCTADVRLKMFLKKNVETFCSNSWEGGWLVLEVVDPHFNRKRNGAAFFPRAKWWQQHFSGCLFKINQHLMAKQSAKISIKRERGTDWERWIEIQKGKKRNINTSAVTAWSNDQPQHHSHWHTRTGTQ